MVPERDCSTLVRRRLDVHAGPPTREVSGTSFVLGTCDCRQELSE